MMTFPEIVNENNLIHCWSGVCVILAHILAEIAPIDIENGSNWIPHIWWWEINVVSLHRKRERIGANARHGAPQGRKARNSWPKVALLKPESSALKSDSSTGCIAIFDILLSFLQTLVLVRETPEEATIHRGRNVISRACEPQFLLFAALCVKF